MIRCNHACVQKVGKMKKFPARWIGLFTIRVKAPFNLAQITIFISLHKILLRNFFFKYKGKVTSLPVIKIVCNYEIA